MGRCPAAVVVASITACAQVACCPLRTPQLQPWLARAMLIKNNKIITSLMRFKNAAAHTSTAAHPLRLREGDAVDLVIRVHKVRLQPSLHILQGQKRGLEEVVRVPGQQDTALSVKTEIQSHGQRVGRRQQRASSNTSQHRTHLGQFLPVPPVARGEHQLLHTCSSQSRQRHTQQQCMFSSLHVSQPDSTQD